MHSTQEEGGIFGISGCEDATANIVLGLHALQHRGHQTYGVATSHNGSIYSSRGFGLVSQKLPEIQLTGKLPGCSGIGQIRFARNKSLEPHNIQPAEIDCHWGTLALAFNGHIENERELRLALISKGGMVNPKSEAELLLYLLAHTNEPRLEDALCAVLQLIHGAFSLLVLNGGCVFAARDPKGYRPLLYGLLACDLSSVFASETCAFDLIAADYVADVEPGEIVIAEAGQSPKKKRFAEPCTHQYCSFELVRIARPDSICFGHPVNELRYQAGRQLAVEYPVDADLVMPMPDSASEAAQGFAEQLNIPCDLKGIVRNNYLIPPMEKKYAHKLRYNIQRNLVKGQRVVVVFSHLFSGGSSRLMVERLFHEAQAKEVHLRIVFPPTMNGCNRGVQIAASSELLASAHTPEDMRRGLQATSLGFTSVAGLRKVLGPHSNSFCYDCVTNTIQD